MPGGIEIFSNTLRITADFEDADAYLLHDQIGYVLQFEESQAQGAFAESDCKIYGTALSPIALCIKTSTDGSLEASKLLAPSYLNPGHLSTRKLYLLPYRSPSVSY